MRDAEDSLLELVDRAYHAAGEPEAWPAFVARFAELQPATASALVFWPGEEGADPAQVFHGYDRSFIESYFAHYGSIDPWAMARNPVGYVGTSQEMVADRDLRQTEFHADWLRQQRMHYGFAALLDRSASGAVATLQVYRPASAGPYEDADLGVIRRLVPHLRRAIGLARRFGTLTALDSARSDLIDRLPQAVLLVTADGVVVRTNEAAERLLSQEEGLRVHRGQLYAAAPKSTQSLRHLIAGCARASSNAAEGAGGGFRVTRGPAVPPLHALVTPTRGGAGLWGNAPGLAAATRTLIPGILTAPASSSPSVTRAA